MKAGREEAMARVLTAAGANSGGEIEPMAEEGGLRDMKMAG